ncbi:formamidopyrimidine-DNA glycosylase-like isoform X1 [Canna indica]|uniref:Formamidopyrimidine-DNA glycosylase-like isoform X1 n=1 Tax=Canna indica TaxID=4628 RepID=A0AAQ3L1J5_9LILI|nr:formamidopyrimidine-DNA glycosylase-like isoform X1 [Canna indica]
MPELPEVEVARRAIEEHCIGKRITECSVADDPKVINGVASSDLESALVGRTIVAALRKGKNLWLRLDSPPFPTFQFGMAGAIYIKGVTLTKYKRSAVSDTDDWPSKYSKVLFKLDDGVEFSFTDKRRFARVRLLENPESLPPISELGPDALLDHMSFDIFVQALSKKKIAIKTLLLDQSFISGIGNWIADEVLYQAKIHPLQIASTLSRESCESLHRCIREVIEKALEVGADSSLFPQDWIFHSREKKPGKAFVNGKKIEFITTGGRTTAYVPELQKLTGKQSEAIPQKKSTKANSDKTVDMEESRSEEKENKKASKKTKTTRGRNQKEKSIEIMNDQVSDKGTKQRQVEDTKSSSTKRSNSGQVDTRRKKAKE